MGIGKRQSALMLSVAAVLLSAPAQGQAPPSPSPGDQRQLPASDAPNVLVWMLDDVGFAQLSSYGGLVETPNIDRLAARGLRYTNYRTAPICSASRAAFLTGRNPHTVHVGGHVSSPRPSPGYDGYVPADAGTVAANLRSGGYTTFALGKWDHLPAEVITPGGPYNLWPLGQGFDRFYGFLAADTDNWHPMLTRGNAVVPPPATPDYHLNSDLTDHAIRMIEDRSASAPRQPFFVYYATGTAHAPHHAPKAWIEHYKGRFDMGWDKLREEVLKRQKRLGLVPRSTKLAPRPEGMPAWDSLDQDQRRLYARQMEAFAAAMSYADEQFGRLLDKLEQSGELDNTLVIVTSDNGASAEGAADGTYNENLFLNSHYASVAENMRFLDRWGGPDTFPHYSFGWAVAGNTPFRYYKQTTFEGGIHVPMIVSWPKGIAARGELRTQFVYVDDMAPTILDVARIPMARTVNDVPQMPMDGLSFAYTFAAPKAPGRKPAQYFEMYGNKGLWADNWTIVTANRLKTWEMDSANPPADDPWQLYDLRSDPGQRTNLAARYPEKVRSLVEIFERQAERYHVNPIGNLKDSRDYVMAKIQHEFDRRGGRWSYPGAVSGLSQGAAPPIGSRSFRMTAELDLMTGGENGPLFAQGSGLGGMGVYLIEGRPTFIFRGFDGSLTEVRSNRSLPAGKHDISFSLTRGAQAGLAPQDITITMAADGKPLAHESVRLAMPFTFSLSESFDIGTDWGGTILDTWRPGAPFEGRIGAITFDFN